jgi:hypothetical protein
MTHICPSCGCENEADNFWCKNCNTKLRVNITPKLVSQEDTKEQEEISLHQPTHKQDIMPKISEEELEALKTSHYRSRRYLKIFGGATIVAIILIAAIILPGFLFLDGVSAAEIKSWALNTYPQVSSYLFSINMKMTTSTSGISGGSFKTIMTGSGAVDNVNQKLMMVTSTEIPEQGTATMSFYILNNILYMFNSVSCTDCWMKLNLSEFENMYSWSSYDQMQMQVDLLNFAKVERLPDESVDGKDCYVLKIIPDIDKFFETMMAQQGVSTELSETTFLSDMMDDYTIKIYTEKSTDYIIKSYQELSMDMSFGGMSMSMDMQNSIVFSDYNQPVNINLPEDALNAVEYYY